MYTHTHKHFLPAFVVPVDEHTAVFSVARVIIAIVVHGRFNLPDVGPPGFFSRDQNERETTTKQKKPA